MHRRIADPYPAMLRGQRRYNGWLDGYCSEGLGYWNYGFGNFYS